MRRALPPFGHHSSGDSVRVKGRLGSQEQKKMCFKLCLSSMSFLCTIHLKRLIAVKKHKNINAVICEKNDVIGQNNVKLCDFIGKTNLNF